MKFNKTPSVEQLQIASRFESLRKILVSAEYAEHLEKTLAFWALPSDRRLPLALLGWKLRDLLAASFTQLSDTPGIGQKKLASLVQLLARAANTDPTELPTGGSSPLDYGAPSHDGQPLEPNRFDPANVSEVSWSQWRASVLKHGLQVETLGRLAPSLQSMTRVIWNTPLGAYSDVTLAQLRAMKTHGEKRVRAVLEVYQSVHALVGNMGLQPHLVVRIVPRCVDQADRWVGSMLQTPGMPGRQEIFDHFIEPLLQQVRTDTTQQIASLAENRLGLAGPIPSVRQLARTMGLTRARVYQLLNEINDILVVRWPMGRHQVYELRDKFQSEAAALSHPPDLTQFLAAIELFYPGSRRGADGRLEQAFEPVEQDADLLTVE